MRLIHHHTPVGMLTLVAGEGVLREVRFPKDSEGQAALPEAQPSEREVVLDDARRQLDEYFARKRRTFDLPLAPQGTPFQCAVWKALLGIGFGETASYRWIAHRIGNPKAVRAVGAANGANPLPIVIPCHRVIGADGSLTGFGGGLQRKRWLLDLEAAQGGLL
jgi:methylated-DNA-[protein]-cysteine S-methyltransferase